ncbi:vacuolar membrane protein [Fusarium subglutinans]|uniref:Vacuolar membrane protein n=1 Tax=Gibberella subglutinans TaxID=42677 RepID=A0A8H5URP5_GIBSU|nr:vacuolar membrane protein [Fusarium subglutinans]KAF5595713.1 vacuolar membrane protein [Fusarium subglutinans]
MQPPSNLEDIPVAVDDAASLILAHSSTVLEMATSAIVSAASMASSTAASATFIASGAPHSYDEDDSNGECSLLGSFALLVQGALGALALLSLVYKRWRERPQRPLKIWFFDVSKQVFGSVLVHIANIFMSMLTSGRFSVQVDPSATSMTRRSDDDNYAPNPCSFYLLNLAIDASLVRFTPVGQPPESVQSGNYGTPPNVWWWLKQSVIYFCGLFGMKICVLIIFIMMPWISKAGDWALGWTEGNEKLQIAFVMMIFPLIMNALQYYIIDSFIKLKDTNHESHGSESDDEGRRRRYDDSEDETSRARLVNSEHETDSESDDEDDKPVTHPTHSTQPNGRDSGEYDPERDGDDRTIIGSSTSARGPQDKVPQELYPKE